MNTSQICRQCLKKNNKLEKCQGCERLVCQRCMSRHIAVCPQCGEQEYYEAYAYGGYWESYDEFLELL